MTVTSYGLAPHRTVVTTYTPYRYRKRQEGDSIQALQLLPQHAAAAAAVALTNGTVQVYDVDSMRPVSAYQPPDHAATSLQVMHCNNNSNHMILTAWKDGTIRGMDVRCQRLALLWQGAAAVAPPPTTALTASQHQMWIGDAMGTVSCWDIRNTGSNGCVWEQTQRHAGPVTQLAVSEDGTLVVSGGTDGRVVVNNNTTLSVQQQLSAPVRRLGLIHGNNDVYCITEDAALHQVSTASCTTTTTTTPLHVWRNHLRPTGMHVSYLIDCHSNTSEHTLSIAMGNYNGELGVVTVDNRHNNVLATAVSTSTGHAAGRIRAWVPLPTNDKLWTAGTDARVCEWEQQQQPARGATVDATNASSCRTTTTQHKRQRRNSPTSTLLPMVLE